jgi:hypothetical protein
MTIWQFIRHMDWVWLPKEYQYFGFREDWHDGPIYSFGFRWFHVYSLGYSPARANAEWNDRPKEEENK